MNKNFTAYLQGKDLAQATIIQYTRCVDEFFKRVKKEETQIKKPDILKHLEYLKNRKGQQNITRKNNLIALNHYFTFLYKAEQIAENPCQFLKIRGTKKRTLYRIYTPEELQQLCDNYYHSFIRNFNERCYASKLGGIPANQREQTLLSRQRNYIMLGMLVYQGLTTKEIEKILLQDIDFTKATVKIKGGKKSNERTLPLNASQIGALINYIENIRPQLLEYHTTAESEKLFFALPESCKQKTDSESLMHTFKPLTKHIKSIDKNLINFKQVRASVITHWLKLYGLRKTQYLAGHRYISSTERYMPNNLQELTEDINKLHPF